MPNDLTDSVISLIFQDDGTFPNNLLPVLHYNKAFSADPGINPADIETVFHSNHWVNAWRNGVYSFHHYHSTAHEVLGIYSGWVKAQLGGPDGNIVNAQAGDVIVIPAGVAHKNIEQSPDFKVVGAYPKGQIPDMKYGKPGERPGVDKHIKAVASPGCDPVYGEEGPLIEKWRIKI